MYLVDTAGSGEEVWAKVTVEPQPDGNLRILSNQICGRPDDLLGVTRPLTGEELAFFNTEFFNVGSGVCMTNMLLSSYYDTAADIDLYELFYNGPTGIQEEVTEAEQTAIGPVAFEHYPIKTQRTEMDAFLQEYLGVALDETNKKNLDQFIYLEEYDAYYLLHGDTNFQRCTVTSLKQNEDGTIALTYEQESGEKGIVTLKGSKGSYQFVSNKEE